MSKDNKQAINKWHLGIILKNARQRSGLNQTQAAEALGYSGAFMSQMERGRVMMPLGVIPSLVKLYSTGDSYEDARLALCTFYLSWPEQWLTVSSILALMQNKDPETLRAGVARTVKLRLKECGIEE
jgi:transcriptional regulator with XRE-family HTH domain